MANHFAGYYAPKNRAVLLAIHPTMLQTYWCIDLLAILIFGFVKLSALFFYRRIFCSGRNGVFNIVTWVTIAVVVAWEICFFVMTFLVCGPDLHNLFYNASTTICTILFPYYEATVISDFLLDVLILVMPIPLIWRLHTNISRKLAVTGVFMFALAGITKTSFKAILNGNTFIVLEAGFTIVAANLPSLWYFTTGVTPAGVLRSVRSLVSLGSSNKSKGSKTEGNSSFKLQDMDASFSSQTAVSESHIQAEPVEQHRVRE
ncbi:MAG: hypothetical protein GOMPHAMPRED_002398 [Gomphillus americanus]|uniref:Rhodopsin domain-containing protein n=1 Tax=Gomphillus americanus TaxID=1940652 RepID=A0A8H3FCB1_9LECA|nr:MAG: hypothetical protein GOMPHAMPRED_002398 [Gomphillus americanus]